jgi:hypothetical protein
VHPSGNKRFSYFLRILSNNVEKIDKKREVLRSKKRSELPRVEIKNARLPSIDLVLL